MASDYRQYSCCYFFNMFLLSMRKLTPASSVKDLGAKFDPTLSFNDHILSTVSSCKSSLCQINRAKHAFSKNLLITVINALVFSKLYYCSSLWSNTSSSNLSRLQGIQNFAARVVSNRGKFDQITPILKELRWFPVKSHLRWLRGDIVIFFNFATFFAYSFNFCHFFRDFCCHFFRDFCCHFFRDFCCDFCRYFYCDFCCDFFRHFYCDFCRDFYS